MNHMQAGTRKYYQISLQWLLTDFQIFLYYFELSEEMSITHISRVEHHIP